MSKPMKILLNVLALGWLLAAVLSTLGCAPQPAGAVSRCVDQTQGDDELSTHIRSVAGWSGALKLRTVCCRYAVQTAGEAGPWRDLVATCVAYAAEQQKRY